MPYKPHLLHLARLLLLTLWLLGCTNDTPPTIAPLSKDAVILAFGDSLTYGTGASKEHSYPAILSKLLARKVINAGVPGELSKTGRKRLPGLLQQHKPQLLLLCHGGNDLLQRRSNKKVSENLAAMITQAQSLQIPVLLISVPAPNFSIKPPAFYAQLAKDHKTLLESEILPAVLSKNSLKSDKVHPNAQGYTLIAEAIAALLRANGAM